MKGATFSRRALVLLLATATALFALSILLGAYDGGPLTTGDKTRPSAYSISAVGHAGLYELLRRMDRPVSRGAGNALALAGGRGTLIVAEPEQKYLSSDEGVKLLSARRLLLVLPKWEGYQDPERPAWIEDAALLPAAYARNVLSLASWDGEIVRRPWPARWKTNTIGFTPAGNGTIQLILPASPPSLPGAPGQPPLTGAPPLRTLVGNDDGILVGERVEDGRKVLVLADPDILANHGIGKGDNAAFMVALIDELRRWNDNAEDDEDEEAPAGRIVFDESVHGYQTGQESPLALLFRFPFVVVTALFAVAAALLALAGSGRFGVPRPPERELDFGKAGLIANGARLLDYAGHHAVVLRRYVSMTIRSAGRALCAPPGLDDAALARWLDQVGETRKVSASCADILQTATASGMAEDPVPLARLLACALDIHRWKGELLHGFGTHRRDR